MKRGKSRKALIQLIVFILIIWVSVCPGYGQQVVRNLTLKEALVLSIQNSHKLAASQAMADQASAVLKQAKENRLPDASVTGGALWLANPNISLNTGKAPGGADSSSHIPSVHKAMYGLMNVSIPIFTGGKLKYGIASAEYLQKAAILQASNDTSAIIMNTINAYANLYKAQETVKVVQQDLAQSLHRDSLLLRLENNGLLARNDRLKSQLQSSSLQVSLLEAESNTKLCTVNIDLMLGLPETTLLQTDDASFQLPENAQSLNDLQQTSLTDRKDYLALVQHEKAANTGISMARASWYPDIALTGGYAAAYIPKVLTLTNAVNIGIGLRYNIGSLWKAKSHMDQAAAKLREVKARELQLEDAIRMQIDQSFENYFLQRKKQAVFLKAVEQAEENFRITRNKFDNDLVNTQDLLDADLMLLQSRINLAVSKADVYTAYHQMLQSAGRLTQ